MSKILKVEARTEQFIEALKMLKELNKLPSNIELSKVLGISSPATISEIKGRRQNIQPESWKRFLREYGKEIPLYNDPEETKTSEQESNYLLAGKKNNLDALLEIATKQSDTINTLSKTVNSLSETLKSAQETIHFLSTSRGNAGGHTATAV